MQDKYEEMIEEVKALLVPEFAITWPFTNTTTVLEEVDNLIEKVMNSQDRLPTTVNELFEICLKQL